MTTITVKKEVVTTDKKRKEAYVGRCNGGCGESDNCYDNALFPDHIVEVGVELPKCVGGKSFRCTKHKPKIYSEQATWRVYGIKGVEKEVHLEEFYKREGPFIFEEIQK